MRSRNETPRPRYRFGEADDEPKVGFDESRERRLVSLALNAEPEVSLFLGGQARQLRDLAQIRRERAWLTLARRMPPRHARSIPRKLRLKSFNFQF
jgi:hypothetical protein